MMRIDFKILLGFIFLISLVSPTLAVNCSIEPQELWLDANKDSWLGENYINISCTCPNNTNNSWAIIINSSGNNISELINLDVVGNLEFNKKYTGLEPVLGFGSYNVNFYCNVSGAIENGTEIFEIKRLGAKLDSSVPSNLYLQDTFDLQIKFKINDISVSFSKANFEVYLDNNLIPSEKERFNTGEDYFEIKAEIPDDFADYGVCDLTIKATYENHTVALTSGSIEVKPLLEVNIINPLPSSNNPYKVTETTNINLTVKVKYKSEIVKQTEPLEFKAMLDDEELTITETEPEGEGIWVLYITVPEQTPKKEPYDLDIFVEYQGTTGESLRPLPVQFVIPFKGKIIDANKYPVHAKIELSGISPLETDDNGVYSAKITPGNYNIELRFDDMNSIRFYDVSLNNSDIYKYTNNPIKYDSFEGTEMDAIRGIALEFAFPFEKVNIIIPSTDFEFDEDQMIVYQCRNWNFGKRYCNSNWEKVKNVDENNYRVSFDAPHFSRIAFALSEEKSLQVKVNLDKKNYFMGETIILQGRVFDDKNNSVGGAKVSYNIKDKNIAGSTTTDDTGEFTVSFNAPEDSGAYNIEVGAEKVYASAKPITTSFKVYKKKGLELLVPNYIDLELDTPSVVKAVVKNTGQVPLNNINIKIENIPFSWYILDPVSIDKLDVDEQREVEINVSISKKQCTDCKSQYSVCIKAESEVNATKNFILNIKGLKPGIKESEEVVETSNTIDIGTGITGLVTATSTTITQNIILILFLIILAILYKIVIRKREIYLDKHKVSSANVIKELKDEILK